MAGNICVLAISLVGFLFVTSRAELQLPEKQYNNVNRKLKSTKSPSYSKSKSHKSSKKSKAQKSSKESKSPKSKSKAKSSKNDDGMDLALNTKPSPAPTLWTKPYGFVQCVTDDDCTFGDSCVGIAELSSTSVFENVTLDVEDMELLGNSTGICSVNSSGPYKDSIVSSRITLALAAIVAALIV